jgi:predicted MFS family arabinose efflux permease
VTGRLLSGIGSGMLLATGLRIAVRRKKAQRLLGGMQLTVVLLAIVLFCISPSLIDRLGYRGLFAALSIIGLVEAIAAAFGLRHTSACQTEARNNVRLTASAPILICVGIAVANCAFTTVWTFIVTIGISLGLTGSSVSNAIALAQPAALIAPVIATVLGGRVGRLRAVVGSLMLAGAGAFLLQGVSSALWLCGFLAVIVYGATFYVPYGIALLGHADSSGSIVSAAPVTSLIGATVGPGMGAHLVSYSVHSVAVVSSLSFLAAIPFFVAGTLLADRRRDS